MHRNIQIGTATLTETVEFRKGYETASWFKMIRCEPQTVSVRADLDERGKVKDTSVVYTFHGETVDAHFPSSFGGVQYTSGDRPEQIGQPETYTCNPYAHSLALSMLRGKDVDLDLFPEYEALYLGYGDPTIDEHAGYSAGIYHAPSDALVDESRGITAGIAENGCVEQDASVAFRQGYARAKAGLARELARKAASAASSATYVWKDAQKQAQKEEVAV